jgi:thiamine biosynthesis lipoprotein
VTTTIAPPRRAWVEQIMGLPVSVHLRGPDVHGAEAELRVGAFFADLRRADAVFSPYRADSQLSRIDRGDLTVDTADPAMAQVLALCDDACERTAGWFDARRLPDPVHGRPRLDPSGLVKGWAVERAARRLRTFSGHGWCLNAGGDVLVATAPGHPPWRIGIEDPANTAQVLRAFTVADAAVATSGGAHRGAHIIDPFTARPAERAAAVTVIGRSLLWADVHATAAAARGHDALSWITTLEGYEALVVDRQGGITTTPGWPSP